MKRPRETRVTKLRAWTHHALMHRELYRWPVTVAIAMVHDELGWEPTERAMMNAFAWAWRNQHVREESPKLPAERERDVWRRLAKTPKGP